MNEVMRSGGVVEFPSGLATFGRERLEFLRDPSREEWQQLHHALAVCGKTHKRWMADSRRAGRRLFGDDAVEAWESQLELAMPELKAMAALEAMETRSERLTDAHLLVLAKKCDDELSRAKWAQVAEHESLAPEELSRSISAGAVVRSGDSGGGGAPSSGLNAPDKSAGIVTIEGISMQFEHWHRKVAACGFPDDWDDARLLRVAELLRPMMQQYLVAAGELARRKDQRQARASEVGS